MVSLTTPNNSTDYYYYANQNQNNADAYISENELRHDLDAFDYYFVQGYEHEQFNYFMDYHEPFDGPFENDNIMSIDNLFENDDIMSIDEDNIEPINSNNNYNPNNNINTNVHVIEYNNDELDDNDDYDDDFIPLAPPPLVRQDLNYVPDDYRYFNQIVDNNGRPIQ